MPFIGNQPSNNFVSLKRQDITGDGTASYTLDYKVASVNDILVYVNHVKQDPSSMTVAGTSLTMGGNVASTDDFYVIFLGQALQTVTPADNTITTAMVQSNAVTSAKMFSGFANGITDADMWRLTSNVTTNDDPVTNVERADEDGFGYLGSGMTQSSGVFTFPKTGIWVIFLTYQGETSNDGTVQMYIKTTIDNGTNWKITSIARDGHNASGTTSFGDSTFCLFDCQDTSTHKCKFQTSSVSGSILGHSDYTRTGFLFVRLGDT